MQRAEEWSKKSEIEKRRSEVFRNFPFLNVFYTWKWPLAYTILHPVTVVGRQLESYSQTGFSVGWMLSADDLGLGIILTCRFIIITKIKI
jgi:hypothetical protein